MFKRKYSPEEKLEIVNQVLEGRQSMFALAKIYNVNALSISEWVRNYTSIGVDAFYQRSLTKRSCIEKESAVLDYLSGKGSIREICKKYRIKSTCQLRQWIKKYNGHEKLKTSGTGAGSIMTKGRKTTFDERVAIVQYCIANAHDYQGTAEKHHISYQQARSYTVKYEADGVEALKDGRGKRKEFEEMTELEKLRAENRILRAEKEHAEMEASFLKKLAEIERRRGLI